MQRSATSCVSGDEVDSCTPGEPGEDDAVCDGEDSDCDGEMDEDYASEATTCGLGACVSSGATSCVNGAVVDSCVPPPANTVDVDCDAFDDDCDGNSDEVYVAARHKGHPEVVKEKGGPPAEDA